MTRHEALAFLKVVGNRVSFSFREEGRQAPETRAEPEHRPVQPVVRSWTDRVYRGGGDGSGTSNMTGERQVARRLICPPVPTSTSKSRKESRRG